MKTISGLFLLLIILSAYSACTGRGAQKKDTITAKDTVAAADTGYTGIIQYKSGDRIIKESTFRNGIREGVTRTFDASGKLYQTFWYENNLREDSACWYYPDGQLFRTTPFIHDTIDGIQKQYYRTGEIRARIGFSKGRRTTLFEEFDRNGKKLSGYPGIEVTINDEYKTKGLYSIMLESTNKSTKTRFYIGDINNGRIDTTLFKRIKTINGKGIIELRKSGISQPNTISVVASILSPLNNRYYTVKKISLPYNDLK